MLCGILVPTSGEVRTCGLDPLSHRRDARPPDRGRLRPAVPAVVGPAAARVLLDPGRHPPAGHRRRHRRTAELVDQLEMARDPRHPGAPALTGPADARRDRRGAAALARAADPRRADNRPRRGVEGAGCGSSSSPSERREARRCCSRRTTWATSSGYANGCWSSTTAGSRTTARCPVWPRPSAPNGCSWST